jgi:hypothetical protein
MSRIPIELPDVSEAGHSLSEPPFDWRDFRPEMLEGEGRFVVELTTYRDHLDSLLADAGKYVAIKGREIIGIDEDLDAAVEAAFRFVPESVLVKQIVEKEPIREVGHVLF